MSALVIHGSSPTFKNTSGLSRWVRQQPPMPYFTFSYAICTVLESSPDGLILLVWVMFHTIILDSDFMFNIWNQNVYFCLPNQKAHHLNVIYLVFTPAFLVTCRGTCAETLMVTTLPGASPLTHGSAGSTANCPRVRVPHCLVAKCRPLRRNPLNQPCSPFQSRVRWSSKKLTYISSCHLLLSVHTLFALISYYWSHHMFPQTAR